MTATELHTSFKIGLDKVDSLNYPNFTSTEIDLFLNQAQDRIVKQRYGINNIKRQSFEETQKRMEDLKTIVKNSIITPTANATDNIDTNAVFVTLPSDHWFIVQERANLTYPDCHGKVVSEKVPIIPIQHNDFNKIMRNPFKKPNERKVLRLMENGKVELIHATGHTITNYYLRYIKEPVRINLSTNITCELSNHIHDEVVAEAIKIALEDIEAKRQPTFEKIISTTE